MREIGQIIQWSLLAVLMVLLCACGKSPPKVYSVLEAPSPPRPENLPTAATLIFEVVEVDSALFQEWTGSNTLDLNAATPLRKTAQKWIADDDGEISETVTLHIRSGKASSIRAEQFMGSFDTKSKRRGISLEASASIDETTRVCHVRLSPILTRASDPAIRESERLAETGWTSKGLATELALPERTYGFLGSVASPAPSTRARSERTSLFFLRVDTNLPPASPPAIES